MSLLNHLRPKWQHSDPEVRAEAVAETDKAEIDLLTAVARQDPDPRVRRIAIKKLERPRLLLELAESDEDKSVSELAAERARTLLVRIACDDRDVDESKRALDLLSDTKDVAVVAEQAAFEAIRNAAFQSIEKDEGLAELVHRARNPALRATALERIESPSALKSVIVDEGSGDLALAALSRLTDLPTLESIVSHHRVSKAVRRNAQARLSSLAPPDHPVKVDEREKKIEALRQQVEALSNDLPADVATALRPLESACRELAQEGPASPELLRRFDASLQQVRDLEARREELRKRAAAERSAGKSAPSDSSDDGATETVAASTETGGNADGSGDGAEPALPAETASPLADRLAEHEGEALSEAIAEARRMEAPDEGLKAALTAAEARLEAWKETEALIERAEAAAAVEDAEQAAKGLDDLVEAWKSRADGASRDQTRRWRRARASLGKRASEARKADEAEAQQKTLEELEARTERLLALAAQDEVPIRDSERELKQAQDFLKSMGALPPTANRKKLRRKLADARQTLFGKTQETRDNEEWKRWANSDIQEALIAKVEALRASKDVPKIAKQVRLIHEEWKRAGAAVPAKAEELWQKYKAARDELKARCDVYFQEQDKERAQNLEKKLALCESVEGLKDSTDWKETAESIKAIQAEWKSLGPVPNEMSESVWKRFRAACDHFFARRNEDLDRFKAERAENLKAKLALCERAEAIQASTDWNQTANELKGLQVEWRNIGPVPRNKSDAIWKRFRTACDFFFDRNKRRDEVENEELARTRVSLVEAMEASSAADADADGDGNGDEAGDDKAAKVKELWAEWKRLGLPSESEADAAARFEESLHRFVTSTPEPFEGTELDPGQSEQRRRKIVEQLEGLINKEDEGPASGGGLEDLAARLKDALASNTMTGGKGRDEERERRAVMEEVRRLRASWLRAAPLGGDAGKTLRERFDTAYATFMERERGRARSDSSSNDSDSRPRTRHRRDTGA